MLVVGWTRVSVVEGGVEATGLSAGAVARVGAAMNGRVDIIGPVDASLAAMEARGALVGASGMRRPTRAKAASDKVSAEKRKKFTMK